MKRILFVDDEPDILEGLECMLHSKRREWHMVFASSGQEALSAMAVEPFDVVVTDMRMPGMNGAELLQQVRARHPRTVRIMLSGQTDAKASMESVFVSHQFLSKPCEPDVLKSVVDRFFGLQALLQQPRFREILGSVSNLPALPRVYKALTEVLAKDEVGTQEVADIVQQDAGIAAKILQLVNSSFFGPRKEISDLRQATTYLGVTTIRDLVLSYEIFRQFGCSAKLSGFSMKREQRHSFLAARIARRLLGEETAAAEAFLASLLHDVGKLVLATSIAEQFQTILQAGAGVERPFHRVEEEALGVSHAEIGAYLLGLWGMPYPVIEAVAHHHHPARVPGQTEFGVLGATHVADSLAREQDGCEPKTIELDEQYLQALGVAKKLPEWRAIAAEEAGDGRDAA